MQLLTFHFYFRFFQYFLLFHKVYIHFIFHCSFINFEPHKTIHKLSFISVVNKITIKKTGKKSYTIKTEKVLKFKITFLKKLNLNFHFLFKLKEFFVTDVASSCSCFVQLHMMWSSGFN